MSPTAAKLRKLVTDPDIVRRYLLQKGRESYADYRRWRLFAGPGRRMLAQALAMPPVAVPAEGPCAIHTLVGVRGLTDSLFTLKRLYGLLPDPFPLVFHEDGSLEGGHLALVDRHFPGSRVIRRAQADREVLGELRARGLAQCEHFRRTSVMGLKIFDLQWFAAGRRVWYVDSDVAFFSRPDAILEAIAEPADRFVDRYNEDMKPAYTWSAEQVRATFGTGYPERSVNAGLLVIQRPTLRWELYERCWEIPDRSQWDEQTLWAVELGMHGSKVLPPEYDVRFRYAWADYRLAEAERTLPEGRPVVSQHYCGGLPPRIMFYRQLLAPRPSARSAPVS